MGAQTWFRRLRSEYPFLLVLLGMGCLLHVATFSRERREGDESVYLGLARTMDWTAGNYTTAEVPRVNEFPARLYRSPLFIHPPLFPYLLKVFSLFGNPLFIGLIFNAAVHLSICLLLWGAIPGSGGWFASILALACPVLTAATIKLHIDGLAGLLLLALVLQLDRARESSRTLPWLAAGVLGGLLANTKLTALAILPVAAGLVLADVFSEARPKGSNSWLKTRGIFLLILVLLGSWHPVRLLMQYGTFYPADLLVHDRPSGMFLEMILQRTRIWTISTLVLLSPLTLLLLLPATWRQFAQGSMKSWGWVLAFLFTAVLAIGLFHHSTERYWALFLPVAYLVVGGGWGAVLSRRSGQASKVGWPAPLVALAVLFMFITTFINAVIQPESDVVSPSIKLFRRVD